LMAIARGGPSQTASAFALEKVEGIAMALGGEIANKEMAGRPDVFSLPAPWEMDSMLRSFSSIAIHPEVIAPPSPRHGGSRAVELGLSPAGELILRGHEVLSRSHKTKEDYQEAYQIFEEAAGTVQEEVDGAEMTSEAAGMFGTLLMLAGDTARARQELERCVAATPESVCALLRYGSVLFEEQELELAIETVQSAIDLDPDNPEPHLQMGQLFILSGDFAQAEACSRRAIGLQCQQPLAKVQLGLAQHRLAMEARGFRRRQQKKMALDTLEEAAKEHAEDEDVLCTVGQVMMESEQEEQAVKNFEASAHKSCGLPLPYVHTGRLLLSLCDLDGAERHLLHALQLDPTCDAARTELGNVYFAQGRHTDGMREFQHAVQLAKLFTEVQAACASLELAKAQVAVCEALSLDLGYFLKMIATIASVIEHEA